MTEINEELNFSKFFVRHVPSEIKVKKENIFYREKYAEIINYIKIILTDSKDLELYNYLKPKGALIINVQPGTDLIDYLKLISNNYYLEYIELNLLTIQRETSDFSDLFSRIFSAFDSFFDKDKKLENPVEKNASDKQIKKGKSSASEKKLFVIEEKLDYYNKSVNINHLANFIQYLSNNKKKFEFIDENTILIWINYDYNEIIKSSSDLFTVFDLFIKIPLLDKIERETILRNFLEKNSKIVFDINSIVNKTEGWENNDLNQLLKVSILKHYLNSDLNSSSNEITDIVNNLIDSGEFIPSNYSSVIESKNKTDLKQKSNLNLDQNLQDKEIQKKQIEEQERLINQIKDENISEFMLNQLYENAASKHFNEVLLIVDKLKNKEPIEENDRKIIAKYPFILNDPPERAQIHLEKAKKRVDLMIKAFGKNT